MGSKTNKILTLAWFSRHCKFLCNHIFYLYTIGNFCICMFCTVQPKFGGRNADKLHDYKLAKKTFKNLMYSILSESKQFFVKYLRKLVMCRLDLKTVRGAQVNFTYIERNIPVVCGPHLQKN